MDSFQIIVTLGPSIINSDQLKKIDELGDCIFRINGAHATPEGARHMILSIREALPSAKIMIDLPGNKVRVTNLIEPIRLKRDHAFKLKPYNLNFRDFYKYVRPGDQILANDAIFTLTVESVDGEIISMKSHSDGLLQNNKGFHCQGVNEQLPFLFERDIDLINVAVEQQISFLSLSFVRAESDVNEAIALLRAKDSSTNIIAKIETKSSLKNLDSILDCVDSVNVDRGDLSSDIGIENLFAAQNFIIERCKKKKKKIFLATQFLKSMEKSPLPYIAELLDLYKTLSLDINGIQLSEETAVGEYPEKCVELIFNSLTHLKNNQSQNYPWASE